MSKSARNIRMCFVAVSLGFVLIQSGCFLVSLEQMEITSYPSERNQIIGIGEELWVAFSLPPAEKEAEALFRVRGGNPAVEGDFVWREGKLYFRPVPDLQPGVRYLLTLEGTLPGADGRIFEIDQNLPFYAGSDRAPAELQVSRPADGERAGLNAPLVFSFSRSMEGGTLENEIEIDPYRDFDFEWMDGGKTISIIPNEVWEAHTRYTWRIGKSVTDGTGIPLQTEYRGTFIAGTAGNRTTLVSMDPVGLFGSTYLVQPGYGRNDSLRFVFSEAMDMESLKAAFDISPRIGGVFYQIDEYSFIFDPHEYFVMNTRYYVTVDTECRSAAGNNIPSEIRLSFLPDIPLQQIEQIVFTGAGTTTVLPPDFKSCIFPEIFFSGAGPDFTGSISIRFAEPFEEPYRTNLGENLSLRAYFPRRAADPELIMKTWNPGNDEITLSYSGFSKSKADPSPERVLYKLSIPGGADMSMNRNGSFLEEEVWVILEAEEE